MFLFLMFFYSWQGSSADQLAPIVDYNIQVSLDAESKTLVGQETLHYTNHSPDIISDLQFHVYAHGALNAASTYVKEHDRYKIYVEEHDRYKIYGHMEFSEIQVEGIDVKARLQWLQGEDATAEDRTVFALPLDTPLLPGETIKISFRFKLLLPQDWDRMGYNQDYFFLGQWFPKIGVWETRGQRGRQVPGWNCQANHGRTEYYADFGNYKVNITVPETFVVGATGKQQGEDIRRPFSSELIKGFQNDIIVSVLCPHTHCDAIVLIKGCCAF